MKLMTYNIWNYNRPWSARRAMLAALIMRHHPDVVALQETRHDWRYEGGKGQGEQLAVLTGYHCSSAVAQVYMPVLRVDEGLTILTRTSPRRVMISRLTRFPDERRDENNRIVLGVELETNGREVHVYDTHWSLSGAVRVENAVETLRFVRQTSGDTPVVLMGDLNAFPDTTPIRFLMGEEEVHGERGDLVNCWSAIHPQETCLSYASWEPDHCVDYVLGRNLPGRVLSAELIGRAGEDGVFPSDHAGIIVDLEI